MMGHQPDRRRNFPAHRRETILLYRCTRQLLTEADQHTICGLTDAQPLDWRYCQAIAESHGVAPLIFANLQQVGLDALAMPTPIRAAFQQATYRNIAIKAGVAATLARICAFCDQQGVDVMVLKGTALDYLIYAQRWYVAHDVDLLLRPRPDAKNPVPLAARMAALEHFFWTLPGFEYEFYTHHDLTMNGLLPLDCNDLWADAQPITIGGQQAWVMGTEDMLLVAAINACRKRFFHLKSLLALATLLAQSERLDWDRLVQKAQRAGATNILYTALLVTAQTVGRDLWPDEGLPTAISHRLRLSPLRRVLIDWVLSWLSQNALPRLASAGDHPRLVDRFLLLPYLTYTPGQLWRKTRQLGRKKGISKSRRK